MFPNHVPSTQVEIEGSPINCPLHGKVWSKRFMMPKPGPERTPVDSYAIAYYECERCFQAQEGSLAYEHQNTNEAHTSITIFAGRCRR